MKTELDNLLWIDELLPLEFERMPKSGGIAYYDDMKLVLILVEKPGSHYEHKGQSYDFDLWKGCILPVEQKKQSAFFLKFLFLENHPANKDWLFIPMDSENFEDDVKQVLREVIKGNALLGTPVKLKNLKETSEANDNHKKKSPKTVRADKKRENSFLMKVLKKKWPKNYFEMVSI